MTTATMKSRLRRAAAQAAKKKSAHRRSSRRAVIARLEKEAADVKSRSFDEHPGGGTGSSADKYDRKKNLPKTKGDDPKLDYSWELGEGYPFDGDFDKPKKKQKALDSADAKRKDMTSGMEPMTHSKPSRPRPKLSSTKRKSVRRKKLAKLKKSLTKTAFNPEGDPKMRKVFDDMESEGSGRGAPPAREKGIAPKQVRIRADDLQKSLGKSLAQFLPKMQEANDNLESAVTGGKMAEIRSSLSRLMSVSQFLMKNVFVPHSGKIQKMLITLRQASAKNAKVKIAYTRLARMEEELSRSRVLICMASSSVRL